MIKPKKEHTFVIEKGEVTFYVPVTDEQKRRTLLLAIEELKRVCDRESPKDWDADFFVNSIRWIGFSYVHRVKDVVATVCFRDVTGKEGLVSLDEKIGYHTKFYKLLEGRIKTLIDHVV